MKKRVFSGFWVIRIKSRSGMPFLDALEGKETTFDTYHSVWDRRIDAESWLRNFCQSDDWQNMLHDYYITGQLPVETTPDGLVRFPGSPLMQIHHQQDQDDLLDD